MIATLKQFRDDERGNVAISFVFVILASLFASALVLIAATAVSVNGSSSGAFAVNTATDARVESYVRSLQSEGEQDLTSVCYPSLETCVAIADVDTSAPGSVQFTAVRDYRQGQSVTERRFVIPMVTAPQSGEFIVSFDGDGNPVWGDVPE